MTGLEKQIIKVLDSGGGERAIHAFLKKHPELVVQAFSRAWNANICEAEFEFGSDYRADFLVLSADSGSWHASLIELEPSSSRLYLNDGTPSKSLRVAQRQIKDWQAWIDLNELYVRQRFSKILERTDTAAQTGVSDHRKAHTEILDPKVVIWWSYHIVIGRRNSLSAEEQFRRAREGGDWGGARISTYDRLVQMAKKQVDYLHYRSLLETKSEINTKK
jgi:Domain of unknown function (DUF4263)